ncbi:MAG: uroporphyrinogen decarboxylase family protein [Deltaproteobacteria bacterium]|nr:uroporphyrinogen decarboxylase family protein [Deltaproteobacteria bacterium]
MTRRERIQALLNRRPVDRVPLYPFLLGFCARNVGCPVAAIYSDAEKSFDAQIKTLEQYDFDWGPIYGYASYGTWEFGGEVQMPSGGYQQAPAHTVFPVKNENDVAGLELPDVKTAGSIPTAMAFSRLQQEHGLPVSIVLGGSFTIAGNLCDAATLCRWMLKKPDLAHRVLRMATDHVIDVVRYWADTFRADEVIPKIWEPLAANSIISPKQFQDFVLPYLKEAAEGILGMGVKHILFHICGDQQDNLDCWTQVPMGDPGLVSFGKEVDLAEAIRLFGDRCIIIGNVDPGALLTGTPETVYRLCREAIEKGKQAPGGFMLSSGCEVSPETPGYHVYLMRKAIEEFGSYLP